MFGTRFETAFPATFGSTGGAATLAREMDRLFNGIAGSPVGRAAQWVAPSGAAARAFPALNVWENADAVVIEAELPGYTLKDFELSLLGDQLTIAGGRAAAAPAEGVVVHRQERPAGRRTRFSRTVTLATPVNGDKVAATLDSGILTITLPKAEAAKPRSINVTGRN